jgi:hypothetical protein
VSLRFPYRRFRVRQPLPTLAGRQDRPRPLISVTVIGPSDSRLVSGLLDTGADDTLFPDALAASLGIDLSTAPALTAAGVGMVRTPYRVAEVTLRIADNQEQREWRAWVAFTSAPLRQPLLGYAGFLQFFTASFHGDREEVELTVNATYPGS